MTEWLVWTLTIDLHPHDKEEGLKAPKLIKLDVEGFKSRSLRSTAAAQRCLYVSREWIKLKPARGRGAQ